MQEMKHAKHLQDELKAIKFKTMHETLEESGHLNEVFNLMNFVETLRSDNRKLEEEKRVLRREKDELAERLFDKEACRVSPNPVVEVMGAGGLSALQRMESDLGKVRTAIGTERFNEIIGLPKLAPVFPDSNAKVRVR